MKQATVTFDNGYFLSVIIGKMFYSNGLDTFEAYCSKYDNDPRGYLSQEEVSKYMIEIQQLDPKNNTGTL